jgi:hypothetical protein
VHEIGEPQDTGSSSSSGCSSPDATTTPARLHLDACLPSHETVEQFTQYVTETGASARRRPQRRLMTTIT